MIFCRLDHQTRSEIEEIQNELIGMLCFNAELVKGPLREIPQIACDDDTGSAAYRGGQHMPVLFIGENKAGDEMFISRHKCIWRCLIHELSCAL